MRDKDQICKRLLELNARMLELMHELGNAESVEEMRRIHDLWLKLAGITIGLEFVLGYRVNVDGEYDEGI